MNGHNLRDGAWYRVKDLAGRIVTAQYRVWTGVEVYEQFDVHGGGRLPVWAVVDGKGLRVAETAVPTMPPIDEQEELIDFYYSAKQEQWYISLAKQGHAWRINAIDGKIYTLAVRKGEVLPDNFDDLEFLCRDRWSRFRNVGYY